MASARLSSFARAPGHHAARRPRPPAPPRPPMTPAQEISASRDIQATNANNARLAAEATGTPATPAPPPRPNYTLDTVPLNSGQQGQVSQVEAAYNEATNAANLGIYEAALRYGDPGLIGQYAAGKYPVVENPYGAIQTIQKDQGVAKTNVGNNLNRRNAFFSGLHGTEIQKVNEEANRKLTEAKMQWDSSQQRWAQALANAQANKAAQINTIKGSAIDQLVAEWMARYGGQ